MEIRQNRLFSVGSETKSSISHLLFRFCHSPVLLAYLIVGTIAAFFQDGVVGLISVVVNLAILGFFAVVIRVFTAKPGAEPMPVYKPKIELVLGLCLYLLLLGLDFLFFNLTNIPGLQAGYNGFVGELYGWARALESCGLPYWAADYAGNAFYSIVAQVLPILILFLALDYRPGTMGLRPRYWKLTLALMGITVLVGLTAREGIPLFNEPIYKTLVIYFIMLFINGFPEELFFRGFLLPRFERIVKDPVTALVFTSILFNALHIPTNTVQTGSSYALLGVISISFPSGLLWGYLYQRTRSVIPGMLFHTAYSVLGFYFFNF